MIYARQLTRVRPIWRENFGKAFFTNVPDNSQISRKGIAAGCILRDRNWAGFLAGKKVLTRFGHIPKSTFKEGEIIMAIVGPNRFLKSSLRIVCAVVGLAASSAWAAFVTWDLNPNSLDQDVGA